MRTPSRRLKLVLTAILTLAARPSALGSGFLTPPFYNVAQAPAGAAAADVNGDGKSDLVTADPNANSISVLLNNGDGTFLPAVNYSTGSDNNSYAVAVGDFNGDGKIISPPPAMGDAVDKSWYSSATAMVRSSHSLPMQPELSILGP